MKRSKEYLKVNVAVYDIISKSIQNCEQHNIPKKTKCDLISKKLPKIFIRDALKMVGQHGEHLVLFGLEGDLVSPFYLALF